jgi:hypothetical protein
MRARVAGQGVAWTGGGCMRVAGQCLHEWLKAARQGEEGQAKAKAV